MGAEPGRRFLKQPAAKLVPIIVEMKKIQGFFSQSTKFTKSRCKS